MDRSSVLVVDDISQNRRILTDRLSRDGYRVLEASDGEQALELVRSARPDVVLLDIRLPRLDGYEVLRRMGDDEELRCIPVVVVSAVDDLESVARCLELGAADYLTKPIEPVVLRARVRGCLEMKRWRDRERAYLAEIARANADLERRVARRTAELTDALATVKRLQERLEAENAYLRSEIELGHGTGSMIGNSEAFQRVLATARKVAPTDATVLILGETGTGKELLARAIHDMSVRRERTLVKVNCAALPPSLIESELFGHERGAFTGATARRIGRFELADAGTIFLDEIAELPVELQGKLLRVLQEGEIERVGGTTTIAVNVRVIAATNRDLVRRVADGTFREDLYYRLNVVPLRCPPLRERPDDIPALVEHLLTKYNARTGRAVRAVSQQVLDRLQRYSWPGNVRELENTIERAVIMSSDGTLELDDLPDDAADTSSGGGMPTLDERQRDYILAVLERTDWRIRGEGGAAEILAVKPTTLEARMKRLGIVRAPAGSRTPRSS